MSKEYLEALEMLKTALHNEWLRFYPQFKELNEKTKFVDGVRMVSSDADAFLIVKHALQRLESIDNANPSEALECLRKLIEGATWNKDEFNYMWENEPNIPVIEQALLKAQEPKKYLTWENLEKDRTYKALLNGIQYELVKRYDDYEYRCDYITLQKKPNVSIYIYEYEKEIFNDLRLEVVEE